MRRRAKSDGVEPSPRQTKVNERANRECDNADWMVRVKSGSSREEHQQDEKRPNGGRCGQRWGQQVSQQPGASTAARQQGVENSFRSHKAMSPSNEPARKDPSSEINQIDQSAKSVARVAEVTGHTVTQPEETKKKKQTKACAASRQNSRGCSRKRRRRRRGGKSRTC